MFLGRHKIPVSLIYSPKQTSHQVATVVTPAATEESSEVGAWCKSETKTYIYMFMCEYISIYLKFCIWNSQSCFVRLRCTNCHYSGVYSRNNPKTNQSLWWMEHLEWLALIRPRRLQRKLRTQWLDNPLIAVFLNGQCGKEGNDVLWAWWVQ